jgi:hypothetical protein
MLLASNKQREKAIFDIFQDEYGLVGKFDHEDAPDFLGPYDGGILGVEITELYSDEKVYGKSLLEHEVAKERIVNRAREKWQKLGLPPLDVYVVFAGDIPNKKESDLTESLFKIVRGNCPNLGEQTSLSIDGDLPEGFGAVLIYNIPGLKKHIWKYGEAGDVETNFSVQLQHRMDEKAKKLSEYLKSCNRCWLIIAALGVAPSSFYEPDEEMDTISYRYPFEKVFFLELFDRTLKELNINKQQVSNRPVKSDEHKKRGNR